MRYQHAIAAAVPVPVSTSSLLLLPMLLAAVPANKKIAVLTADSRCLDAGIWATLGITQQSRLVIEGLEGTASYSYMWEKEGEINASGQGLAGVTGVRQGQRAWLSARIVDDAAVGTPCPRAGPEAGHECLDRMVQGTVCKLLGQEEIKPHKVRYYLEDRNAEFEQKMAEVLYVYREVQILKKAARSKNSDKPVAIFSYDEKSGIQAHRDDQRRICRQCWACMRPSTSRHA
ncbi:hypothetical protein ABIB73_007604 [Bradyrhizobium sp. F1.4.3]